MTTESNITTTDEWYIGADKILRFTVVDAAGATQIITGWTVRFTMAKHVEDDPLITKATGGSGISLSNPTEGILDVSIVAADTEDMNPGTYYYSLWRTDSGAADVLAYGYAKLKESVTP